MSANAEVLRGSGVIASATRERTSPKVEPGCPVNCWSPEDFAQEQINSLVRQVFFSNMGRPVKQVVFTAMDGQTDVASICDQVGRSLARETRSDVAIVSREPEMLNAWQDRRSQDQALQDHRGCIGMQVKNWSPQAATNLWRVPELLLRASVEASGPGLCWLSCLERLRAEFEFAVIHGPVAGITSEAATLGSMADGMILVLGANTTRKASAWKIKEKLEAAQSQILGTVLAGRKFPVPERIYRRL